MSTLFASEPGEHSAGSFKEVFQTFLAINVDPDQTVRVRSLIWVYTGRKRGTIIFSGGGGRWGEGGGGLPIYGIVRMCVPNSPLFQHCQVYDWPPFFNKMYMN